MKNSNKGHYAWDCIGEFEGKHLMSPEEKEAVCKKIDSSLYTPSLAVTIAIKIVPIIVWVLFLYGYRLILEASDTFSYACGFAVWLFSLGYMLFALMFYLIKGVYIYDRWKTERKKILARDVYRVPVAIGSTFQGGGVHKPCYASLRYTEDEDFLDTYQITEYLYHHTDTEKLYCCYYEGKPEKYCPGKYKLFFIDEECD